MLVGAECQKYVAGLTAELPVAGIHEEHSVSDYGTGDVEGAALGGDVIHGIEGALCVEVPEDGAVAAGISTKMSIEGTREYRSRNGGHGCGLGRATGAAGTFGRRSFPDELAGDEIERRESSSDIGIQTHFRRVDTALEGRV